MYSKDVVKVRITQFCLSEFRSGDFSLNGEHDIEIFLAIINTNLRQNREYRIEDMSQPMKKCNIWVWFQNTMRLLHWSNV